MLITWLPRRADASTLYSYWLISAFVRHIDNSYRHLAVTFYNMVGSIVSRCNCCHGSTLTRRLIFAMRFRVALPHTYPFAPAFISVERRLSISWLFSLLQDFILKPLDTGPHDASYFFSHFTFALTTIMLHSQLADNTREHEVAMATFAHFAPYATSYRSPRRAMAAKPEISDWCSP